MIIEGSVLTQKVGGQVFYRGDGAYNGRDLLMYNRVSGGWNDVWTVDKDNQVLTLDGVPMRKENGSTSTSSSSSRSSYSYDGSSHGSHRFSSADDVIGWLSDKTFYNGSRRLRIRPNGVWLNDYCATFAPRVERYESWKALIRAMTATGERLSFLVNPIDGAIIDEAGDVFKLR